MKKTNNATKENRMFRRAVRRLLAEWRKRQNCGCLPEARAIMGLLREIETSIEIMAREMARMSKRRQ